MRDPKARRLAWLAVLLTAIALGPGRLIVANSEHPLLRDVPDVVILNELEDLYEPVPFDHLSHAKMAEMWNGCVTCHHRTPHVFAGRKEGNGTASGEFTQADAAEVPACKSCHSTTTDDADISMPSLKGAYHRQCLNCHKEWMHENACVICHLPKEEADAEAGQPSPGDIIGRMHPPIPEPEDVFYKTRFTPADGGNVLFRHENHTSGFGITCVGCHHRDSCSHCHTAGGDEEAAKPLNPGMTWDESHGPCMSCHSQARCTHCHYHDDEDPPDPFHHDTTGQGLDEDHAGLACAECHEGLLFITTPTCGDAACHSGETIAFPADRPGPVMEPVEQEPEGETITETTVSASGDSGP